MSRQSFKTYLRGDVLPLLRGKRDQFLLQELVLRWEYNSLMTRTLHKMFMYLNKYYVEHNNLPPLQDVGVIAFRTEIFEEMKGEITRSVIAAINRERDGETVDRSLLKKVVDIYVALDAIATDTYSVSCGKRLAVPCRVVCATCAIARRHAPSARAARL